ncbi:MAG: single-stranded DNA-binding protein [Spirochaetales bacterium]|nr:single-stranded DNA-binding protein [Spirochaetales bacterium]
MNSLNSILLEGNLVRDPEFTHTPKGTPICKFAIASNRFYKIEDKFQEEVSFFNVTAWAKVAERCNERLKKGKGVRVVGRLKQDRWKGNDGIAKSLVYVVADHVEFKPNFVNKDQKDEKTRVKEQEYKTVSSF